MQTLSFVSEDEFDELLEKSLEIVSQYERASASLIQRCLGIGYARAARIIDQLEKIKAISPAYGARPREVLFKSLNDFLKTSKINSSQAKPDSIPSVRYKSLYPIKFQSSKKPLWEPQMVKYLNSKFDSNKIFYLDDSGLIIESIVKSNSFIYYHSRNNHERQDD